MTSIEDIATNRNLDVAFGESGKKYGFRIV